MAGVRQGEEVALERWEETKSLLLLFFFLAVIHAIK